jgi:hypothetical protein
MKIALKLFKTNNANVFSASNLYKNDIKRSNYLNLSTKL